jgi:hypothetical protein
MRQMPSETDTTVPWLRMSALADRPFDAALDQFRNFCGIELHDSFLLSLVRLSAEQPAGRQRRFHLFQTGLDRGVEHLVAHHHANAANQGRVQLTETLSLRPKRFSSTADRSASAAGVDREGAVHHGIRRTARALTSARNCAAISGKTSSGRSRSRCAGSSCAARAGPWPHRDHVEHLLVVTLGLSGKLLQLRVAGNSCQRLQPGARHRPGRPWPT